MPVQARHVHIVRDTDPTPPESALENVLKLRADCQVIARLATQASKQLCPLFAGTMSTDLKHLGFVKSYATAGVEAVANSKTCVHEHRAVTCVCFALSRPLALTPPPPPLLGHKRYAKAVQLYTGTKESSGALKSGLEVLEGLVHTYATPLAQKATAYAPTALAIADAKVRDTCRRRVARAQGSSSYWEGSQLSTSAHGPPLALATSPRAHTHARVRARM